MDEEKIEKERLLLLREIHKHIIEHSRHIETAWWAVAAILIPVTAGAFVAVFQYKESYTFRFVAGISSTIIWWFYIGFTKYVVLESKKWLEQAYTIEKELGIKFFTQDKNSPEEENLDERRKLGELYSNNMQALLHTIPKIRFDIFMTYIAISVTIMWIILLGPLVLSWIFKKFCFYCL